ncbi:DNA alkylation repair protein [Roseivirga pacifica]|uniref:DNA alkylation repair protein n=1 Tax=Roseivirga pacifica TaxID=1267423 RepID=UPI00227C4EC4
MKLALAKPTLPMNPEILNRKGARKVEDIPQAVLSLLNRGEIETVNLTEWLAIDHAQLIQTVFPALGMDWELVERISNEIALQKKPSTMSTTKLVGAALYKHYANTAELDSVLDKLSSHKSDTIRCYAPFLIGLNENLSISEKLTKALRLVADKHFGVREVIWLALRPAIEADLDEAIEILSEWTQSEDENVRRFTTEATRPRGVWCKHIEQLKESPEIALPILEQLKSDTSKYVQDSVGNWLNDASKSKPEFMIKLCDKWSKASPTTATEKIVKRAKRSIDKK